MTKEEIIQKFYDRIVEGISNNEISAKDTKNFAVAFKIIHNIEQNDDFLKQLEKMSSANPGTVHIQPMEDYRIYCKNPDDESGFGFCD